MVICSMTCFICFPSDAMWCVCLNFVEPLVLRVFTADAAAYNMNAAGDAAANVTLSSMSLFCEYINLPAEMEQKMIQNDFGLCVCVCERGCMPHMMWRCACHRWKCHHEIFGLLQTSPSLLCTATMCCCSFGIFTTLNQTEWAFFTSVAAECWFIRETKRTRTKRRQKKVLLPLDVIIWRRWLQTKYFFIP